MTNRPTLILVAIGAGLIALGRWLQITPVPHHCGDPTCTEAHP